MMGVSKVYILSDLAEARRLERLLHSYRSLGRSFLMLAVIFATYVTVSEVRAKELARKNSELEETVKELKREKGE